MRKLISIGFCVLILAGCVLSIDSSIKKYQAVADRVNLGDSKEKVLGILLPTQTELQPYYKKEPEKYYKEGTLVEIYFMRSRRQADGLTTDDEFTPYLFNDNKLVGIGWQVLGGASTQGQASPTTNVTTTTNVVVY